MERLTGSATDYICPACGNTMYAAVDQNKVGCYTCSKAYNRDDLKPLRIP